MRFRNDSSTLTGESALIVFSVHESSLGALAAPLGRRRTERMEEPLLRRRCNADGEFRLLDASPAAGLPLPERVSRPLVFVGRVSFACFDDFTCRYDSVILYHRYF